MYCKNCNSNYRDDLDVCPNCEKSYEKNRMIINDRIREIELNKKIRRTNMIIDVIFISSIIYTVIEDILHFKICGYYSTSNKYNPAIISIIVLALSFIWIGFKRNLFANCIFVIGIVFLSIFGTIYFSQPMMSSMWVGEYLYKEYWLLYYIYNFIVVVQCSAIVLTDSNYILRCKDNIRLINYAKLWFCTILLCGIVQIIYLFF